MQLSEFIPRPALVTPSTLVEQPRFPVIDAHNHLGPEFGGGWDRRPVGELLAATDAAHVRLLVDLDGGWGEDILDRRLQTIKAAAPERFRMFGGVDWNAWPAQGDAFGAWAAERLRSQVARGADGLKIWKPFGLHVRDQHGALVAVDDPRLDPLWAAAGQLDVPVLIHVADALRHTQIDAQHCSRPVEIRGPDCFLPLNQGGWFLGAIAEKIRAESGRSAISGGWYVFFSRRRDRVRIFYWDRDGYAMWMKRLEAGSFKVARTADGYEELTAIDLAELLSGVELSRIKFRREAERAFFSSASCDTQKG